MMNEARMKCENCGRPLEPLFVWRKGSHLFCSRRCCLEWVNDITDADSRDMDKMLKALRERTAENA